MELDPNTQERIYWRYHQNAMERYRHFTDEMQRWQIELVRHLALVNSAGLAGSVIVLAASRPHNGGHLTATALFFVGLIFAVLAMYCGTKSWLSAANEMVTRINAYQDRLHEGFDRSMEYAKSSLLQPTITDKPFKHAAVWLGWGSAGMFLLGGFVLIASLLCGA